MDVGETFPLVLFGAGASRPAGVPTALEMTHKMMRMSEGADHRDYLRALRAISGGLQMGFGDSEAAAVNGADVEQVLNAVLLLGDRFAMEFSPFVGTWHPIIEDLERRSFASLNVHGMVRSAVSGLTQATSKFDIQGKIAGGLREAFEGIGRHLSQRPDGALFRRLAHYLTGILIELTCLDSPDRLVYLDPLLVAARSAP